MSLNRRLLPGLTAIVLLCVAAGAAAQKAQSIDFWTISSYDYNPRQPFEPAPARAVNTIPASVRALEGRTVEIDGNAMTLDYSSGMMSEFILQSSADNCAFGAVPRINEWIHVTMRDGKQVRVLTALDVTVTGTFHIQEQVEDGLVVGLYRIVADSVK